MMSNSTFDQSTVLKDSSAVGRNPSLGYEPLAFDSLFHPRPGRLATIGGLPVRLRLPPCSWANLRVNPLLQTATVTSLSPSMPTTPILESSSPMVGAHGTDFSVRCLRHPQPIYGTPVNSLKETRSFPRLLSAEPEPSTNTLRPSVSGCTLHMYPQPRNILPIHSCHYLPPWQFHQGLNRTVVGAYVIPKFQMARNRPHQMLINQRKTLAPRPFHAQSY